MNCCGRMTICLLISYVKMGASRRYHVAMTYIRVCHGITITYIREGASQRYHAAMTYVGGGVA